MKRVRSVTSMTYQRFTRRRKEASERELQHLVGTRLYDAAKESSSVLQRARRPSCLCEERPPRLNTAEVSLRNLLARFRTFENGTVLR